MPTQISENNMTADAREFKIAIRWEAVAGTYPIDMGAIDAYDIVRAYFQTDTGTINAHFEIEGTDVEFDGGDEILAVTSTIQSEDAASANSVAVGEVLTMILDTPASSPTIVSVDLVCRKTVS